ncbi:MAG: SLC13/DASS family transporter [Bacteroidales bacterium]|nr:SLC13/DASS family transporter [Bacteroidales bacterium]MBR3501270.1 SLC13/DASS family transporter [Bacteroidales bacterium]
MFKKFVGFNLVEEMHKLRHNKIFNPLKLKKKTFGILFVLAVFLTLWFLPTESFGMDGLTLVQQRIIAIFAYATLMWVLELVPAWATSVSIMVFLLLFTSNSGVKWLCNPDVAGQLLSYKQVMASFADPVVMLFIGGFVLAIATTKTGLDVHLARVLLSPFGKKSENILLGFMLVTALFSMFISNTATTAMMLTFLTPVFKQLPEAGKGRTAMALSIPIAANLGGMGTPIGTPPNTIALKYLNDPEGLNLAIGFGQWMLFMVPLVIIMIILAWILLKKVFPFTQKTIELKIDGEMKKGAQTTIVIVTMIITILLWMTDTLTGVNTYTVALIPFAVFALTGIITKYDLEEINWSVIWMVAGGFALGYAMNGSGLAALVIRAIPFGQFSPVLIVLLSGLICYVLSNLISHSATAALLMPILVVVCTAMGDKLAAIGGPTTVLIGVAIASSSAMILPISTPPNALAYATNLVQQKDMARMGITVGVLSIVLGYVVLIAARALHIV